jgi:hypothetical protein
LGLITDDTLSWKQHMDLIVKKMTSACYALRQVKYFLSSDILKLIYHAHVHSIMSNGIICWGNSPGAKQVFKIQKKIIRIITHLRHRDSCKEIFKNLQIMTLCSQYIFSIMLFVVNEVNKLILENEGRILI